MGDITEIKILGRYIFNLLIQNESTNSDSYFTD